MSEEKPARTIPHRWVLVATFVVYALTRYPEVGGRVNMGDSAKFQFLARTLGIGHSPGNPLYLMASALWVRVPLPLSDATKVTLLSSVFGVATVALVGRIVAVFGAPPVLVRPVVLETRTFAVLLLGLGSLFWTLSTEAEVYTLGSVFVAGVVLGTALWIRHRDRRALLAAIACLGLGLGNHLTIAALGPALLWVLLREKEGRAALRSLAPWFVAVGALAGAALSYGWIAWRVRQGTLAYSEFPPGPFDASKFLRFVTATGVMDATLAKTTYQAIWFERLPELAAQLQKQWSWPLLLFLPLGVVRLSAIDRTFSWFVLFGVLGHFAIAAIFRIPDPEGLFVPVSLLLVIPLATAPRGNETLSLAMLAVHIAFVIAHFASWWMHPLDAYVQQTPEGRVVIDLPNLHAIVPRRAMVVVPCGHYGCVEVVSYYHLADPELREKEVSFVRLPWSEWDDTKTALPVIDPASGGRDRPLCVLLSRDAERLERAGLVLANIARAPARAHGRTYVGKPLRCAP